MLFQDNPLVRCEVCCYGFSSPTAPVQVAGVYLSQYGSVQSYVTEMLEFNRLLRGDTQMLRALCIASFLTLQTLNLSKSHTLNASDLTIQNLADANQASISSFASLKATVKTTFRNSSPEFAALDQELLYFSSGQQERISIQQATPRLVPGDLTGLSFPVGNKQIHNGPSGYRMLDIFDDLRDEFGNFPVDSPAVGSDDASRGSLGYHLAKYYLGLEVLAGSSEAHSLSHLLSQDPDAIIFEEPTPANDQCFGIQFSYAQGAHRVWLSRDHGFMIRRMEWIDGSKTTTDFRVVDFEQHGELYICKEWELSRRSEGIPEVVLEGEVEVHSVNSPIHESDLTVQYPEGLPFFDHKLGQAGVWGIDGPAIMFSSKEEAQDWFTKRKQDYIATKAKSNPSNFLGAKIFITSCVMFLFFWVVRRRFLQKKSIVP